MGGESPGMPAPPSRPPRADPGPRRASRDDGTSDTRRTQGGDGMNRFTSPARRLRSAGQTARAGRRLLRGKRGLALLGVLAMAATPALFVGPGSAAGPVGEGFTVTPSDLAFILKQIKIAERHAATRTASNPCDTMVGSGANQIPDRLSSYGLRTVDGSCNNL